MRNEFLRLTHRKSILQHAFGSELLLLAERERQDHFGVAHGQPPVAHVSLNLRCEFQQAQRIRHGHATLAHLRRDVSWRS